MNQAWVIIRVWVCEAAAVPVLGGALPAHAAQQRTMRATRVSMSGQSSWCPPPTGRPPSPPFDSSCFFIDLDVNRPWHVVTEMITQAACHPWKWWKRKLASCIAPSRPHTHSLRRERRSVLLTPNKHHLSSIVSSGSCRMSQSRRGITWHNAHSTSAGTRSAGNIRAPAQQGAAMCAKQ